MQNAKYGLNFKKLRQRMVRSQTMAKKKGAANLAASEDENGKARLTEEGRGYVCSELVIKAYKCVGLMQSDEASSNWLPADLASDKNKM